MLAALNTATSTWKTVGHDLLKLNRHILYNPAMLSVFTVYSCVTNYHTLSGFRAMSLY